MTRTGFAKWALAAALLFAAMPAAQARGFRGGGWGHGGGGVIIGPAYAPWSYWGPYDYYEPGFYGGFAFPLDAHPNSGEVKLDTKQKNAEVYVNGALAGTVKDLKSTWMHQGTYDLELRTPGGESYSTKIYVLPGKTVHVRPDFSADHKS